MKNSYESPAQRLSRLTADAVTGRCYDKDNSAKPKNNATERKADDDNTTVETTEEMSGFSDYNYGDIFSSFFCTCSASSSSSSIFSSYVTGTHIPENQGHNYNNDFDTNDVEILDLATIDNIGEDQLPEIITSQYKSLIKLEDKVTDAVKKAADAKEKANDASNAYVGWVRGHKNAIELLQEASKGLSESVLSIADAQQISFEYLTKMAQIMKFLFALGTSSIAMNRMAVREIKARLEGASEEELSDLARQELNNVLIQLKSQENILKTQEDLKTKVREHSDQLSEKEQIDTEQSSRIAENIRNISMNKEILDIQKQKDEEHDQKFLQKDIEDKNQDSLISENAQKIGELESQFDQRIDELKSQCNNLKIELSEIKDRISVVETSAKNKVWLITLSIVAASSLILNLLQLLGVL